MRLHVDEFLLSQIAASFQPVHFALSSFRHGQQDTQQKKKKTKGHNYCINVAIVSTLWSAAAMSGSKRSAFEDAPELTAAEKKGGFADEDAIADEKHRGAKAEEKKSRRGGGSRLRGDVGQFRRVNRTGYAVRSDAAADTL